MKLLILPISCLICVLTAVGQRIDKKGYSHQEKMVKSFAGLDTTLSWVVRDLVKEVKDYKELVSEQGKKIANEMEVMKSDVRELVSEQGKKIADKMEGMKTDLEKVVDQLHGLKNTIDIMRSEVRLISQQKLTWQNSTHGAGWYSDFAVDGVYRMTNDEAGINPIQHTDDSDQSKLKPNNMVMINLGALFKIHTVKLWKRTSGCCDHRNIGLLIYADDTLIGATSEARKLYNLSVHGDVYAKKIYVKNPRAEAVQFLEIQVFGTGPFGKDEVTCKS